MSWAAENLWIIPLLPFLGFVALTFFRIRDRETVAWISIGSIGLSFLFGLLSFFQTLTADFREQGWRHVDNFSWFQLGDGTVQLGWVLDPLSSAMGLMVSFVGAWIFVFSVGYMEKDNNFQRFFCFLCLFASAMLGVVYANSLLLFFICWEVVGVASYLLIGFWHHKPAAAAAARKAFITTRIGDLGFLLGMVWLYHETGTLIFYDGGNGCMEQSQLAGLVGQTAVGGLMMATAISLLIFCGAIGKSGQLPLHVWLPDAMEGPTPVSALIHAATMVAAGVYLVARVYPLMDFDPAGTEFISPALTVVTWVGAGTALMAAMIALAQNDIKRILAYSTVSQLGYMMMGLGVGGVAVGMFHLLTHAFFKALLFLGSGSVIHGCHEEQDIRRMGGLKAFMPLTFYTYAVGMMALSGVPLFFSGFWSKDAILHAAMHWEWSHLPYLLGLIGAVFTAFYMTRQMAFVFFGTYRGAGDESEGPRPSSHAMPHESPRVMTLPLVVLAVFAVLLGFWGTPAWPWLQSYLEMEEAHVDAGLFLEVDFLSMVLFSSLAVGAGLGLGWMFYGKRPSFQPEDEDPLNRLNPALYRLLGNKFYFDEFYQRTFIRWTLMAARGALWMDRILWNGVVKMVSILVVAGSTVARYLDEFIINLGFDETCRRIKGGGFAFSRLQSGQVQRYLTLIGLGVSLIILFLAWGIRDL